MDMRLRTLRSLSIIIIIKSSTIDYLSLTFPPLSSTMAPTRHSHGPTQPHPRPRQHRQHRPHNQRRIGVGDVVSFTSSSGPTQGVVTSLVNGEVHVQHLVPTPLGVMRAHRRCSTPRNVKLTTSKAPRWVKEPGCLRDPLPGCDSCHHRRQRRQRKEIVYLVDGVEHGGESYHKGDLVFRHSLTKGEAWGVGVAKSFGREGVVVQLCGRLRTKGGFEVS